MKRRKILALLLALVMTLGTTTAFAADTFSDVAEDAYYADAVAWAVEKEITNGRGGGIFDPSATVTRAEAVTFLWRMAGRPEPAQTETFTDVESDANNSWYKTAVQWAVENGITNGTGNGKFSPAVTCSRGMILTMLYRMEGSPFDEAMATKIPADVSSLTADMIGYAFVQAIVEGMRTENALIDVKEGDYFELPVIWAMLNGILGENQVDTDAETVAVQPNAPCPRGEMVHFLYRASGDAPAPAAPASVEVGTIPETAVLDKEGVKITVTGIETDNYGDARLDLTIVNGSAKTLRIDTSDFFVNTFSLSPQVYIPVEDEDGWVFYADAIAAPGETKDIYVSLSSLESMGIDTVFELELKMALTEVEKSEDSYDYVDEFAVGDTVRIQTSLYIEGTAYDLEGTTVYNKDGLKILVVKAENDEYMGPQIAVYAYNSGSEEVSLELAELKLDGKTNDAFFALSVPAGKRSVGTIYIDYDYENIPVVKEAELTLRTLDPETWEPAVTFDPVKVTFTD